MNLSSLQRQVRVSGIGVGVDLGVAVGRLVAVGSGVVVRADVAAISGEGVGVLAGAGAVSELQAMAVTAKNPTRITRISRKEDSPGIVRIQPQQFDHASDSAQVCQN